MIPKVQRSGVNPKLVTSHTVGIETVPTRNTGGLISSCGYGIELLQDSLRAIQSGINTGDASDKMDLPSLDTESNDYEESKIFNSGDKNSLKNW